MAPPKNPPASSGKLLMTRTTGKVPKKPGGVVGAIGKAANAIADKMPSAQKNTQRRMRGNPQGGATRG